METIETLGDALPKEMARVRDKLIPIYQACGRSSGFAIMLMRKALDDAAKAMAEGDVVAMIRAYQDLKEFSE